MRIAVVGTGYVGLVTGVVLADLGNQVLCIDNDSEKIARLRQGISPIYEPGIEEFLRRNIDEGRLSFSESVADACEMAEIIFIAVGTPSMPDGSPDLRAVRSVAQGIGQNLKRYTVIVNKSTVPVGSGEVVSDLIIEAGANPELFDVVSNPEFLREGSALHDSLHPDRIIIGTKKEAPARKLLDLFAPLDSPSLITDLASAELIKYASNAFLATKISFINSLSRLCELTGGNVADVAKGMGMDARIGPQFLSAGLGWGGSCLPKDVLGLIDTSNKFGFDFKMLRTVTEVNDDQSAWFIERMRRRLGGFSGKTIGMLGLAFKPNTDDIRYAKSLVIIDAVEAEGGVVQAFDPVAMEAVKAVKPNVLYKQSALEVANGADCIVLVTEWNEFKQLDLEALAARVKQKILFDGRRIYRPDVAERAGFEYHAVGRKSDY